jgi:hypothetical protein
MPEKRCRERYGHVCVFCGFGTGSGSAVLWSCGPVGVDGGACNMCYETEGGEGMPPHTPLAQYETDGGEGLPLPPLARYNICDRRSWKRGGRNGER